jgi:hypothetical protein
MTCANGLLKMSYRLEKNWKICVSKILMRKICVKQNSDMRFPGTWLSKIKKQWHFWNLLVFSDCQCKSQEAWQKQCERKRLDISSLKCSESSSHLCMTLSPWLKCSNNGERKRLASIISTCTAASSQTLDAWSIKRNMQLFFAKNWNCRRHMSKWFFSCSKRWIQYQLSGIIFAVKQIRV